MSMLERLNQGGDAVGDYRTLMEKGDMVTGVLVGLGDGNGAHGEFKTLILDEYQPGTELCSGTEVEVPMWGTVLKGWFEKNARRLVPGARVGIMCKGMIPNAAGTNEYRDHNVVLEDAPTLTEKLSGTGPLPI